MRFSETIFLKPLLIVLEGCISHVRWPEDLRTRPCNQILNTRKTRFLAIFLKVSKSSLEVTLGGDSERAVKGPRWGKPAGAVLEGRLAPGEVVGERRAKAPRSPQAAPVIFKWRSSTNFGKKNR